LPWLAVADFRGRVVDAFDRDFVDRDFPELVRFDFGM